MITLCETNTFEYCLFVRIKKKPLTTKLLKNNTQLQIILCEQYVQMVCENNRFKDGKSVKTTSVLSGRMMSRWEIVAYYINLQHNNRPRDNSLNTFRRFTRLKE